MSKLALSKIKSGHILGTSQGLFLILTKEWTSLILFTGIDVAYITSLDDVLIITVRL